MTYDEKNRGDLMGTTRKTITVTDQQDNWIKAQIAAGQFTNDSEYVRDLIRRDQASQTNINAIRAALIEGEEVMEKLNAAEDWARGQLTQNLTIVELSLFFQVSRKMIDNVKNSASNSIGE